MKGFWEAMFILFAVVMIAAPYYSLLNLGDIRGIKRAIEELTKQLKQVEKAIRETEEKKS